MLWAVQFECTSTAFLAHGAGGGGEGGGLFGFHFYWKIGAMFGNEDVKRLVECAGRALEFEDRYLTGCAYANGWANGPVGIRINSNEHYYQSIIWRALMSSFPWRPQTERESRVGPHDNHKYDLVFYRGESDEQVAFAELKGWWVDSPENMRTDIDRLAKLQQPGVMLILTSHRRNMHDENLRKLAEELGVEQNDFVPYRFDTPRWPGEQEDAEFIVIGFLVARKAMEVSA